MLEARLRVALERFELAVELRAQAGEVLGVVGPNGAGKTTLLRALAGLERLAGGEIALDGATLDAPERGIFVPPERRPVALAFQDLRLFPHLSALDNAAFGRRAAGERRAPARARAREWLDRLGAGELAPVRPAALSGGQAQRVALARALAAEPRLLLLDEPLSAIDVGARGALRRELSRHLAAYEGICLLVTHDPVEAAVLADRLCVLEDGRAVQQGTPDEIAVRPRSRYVADFVGVNLFRGRADGLEVALAGGGRLRVAHPAAGDVIAVVHPRAVSLHAARPEGSPQNVWSGVVESLEPAGDCVRVRVAGEPPIVAEVTPAAIASLSLAAGARVWVSLKATEIAVDPD
jgi:molybdate transport system ATP-binding protein